MRPKRIMDEFFREEILSGNRANPIGEGTYGTVFDSDHPGFVIKQNKPGGYATDFEREAGFQQVAADMGFAPQVASVETFPEGTQRIEMADIRRNFEPVIRDGLNMTDPNDIIGTSKQLGMLALKGIGLEDRNAGNVVRNKMTGRPMQIDFGIAGELDRGQQAAFLSEVTQEGMEAAGLKDFGVILRDTVMDYLEGGDVDLAYDLAKQGFSRLQKIKGPFETPIDLF